MDKQKYRMIIAAIALVFFYLLFTEVGDRWSEMFRSYRETSAKEEGILNPDDLTQRKMALTAKKRMLTAKIKKSNEGFEQNQIGVVRLMQTRAKENRVMLRALAPLETRTVGQMIEQGFSLEVLGAYHTIGSYCNALETGPIPIKILKFEASSQKPGSPVLNASIQAKAYVFPKSILQ